MSTGTAPHLAAMRLACPACAAEYDVPEAVLAAATRAMRCARCQQVWTPQATAPEPAGRPAAPPLPFHIEPASRALVTAQPVPADTRLLAPDPPHRRSLGAAWVLTAAVLIAGLVGAVAQREAVMAAWPPAARAYAAVGLR